MKIKRNLILNVLICSAFIAVLSQAAFSQQYLLNEIEIDPPAVGNDACQYSEIKGPPGATVPGGIYFLSVNSDAGNFGFATQAVNIGGLTVGSNGTITLHNNFSGPCPSRTYSPQTTLVEYISPLFIGAGSETYLVVQSPISIISGQDLDTNDDGVFDAAITVLDGFALLVNPKEEYVYGASAGVVNISNTTSLDQPDAVTRFPSNTTPFVVGAFYYGELAGSPDGTLEYADPRSANFPVGGALTPGAPNVPAAVVPGDAVADFNGDGKTDYSVTRTAAGMMTWYNAINGSGETTFTQFGAAGDIPVPEDFDGDNKDDIAIWRPGTAGSAAFWILRSTDSTVQIVQFGMTGDDPAVVGDWDGDGIADPSVYRDSASGNQSVFYYRGSMNNPGGDITFVPWGITGDRAVRGDFDGDAKRDAAVYRSSDQTWYIRRSSDAQLLTQAFGIPSDILVPGDFDGDGKTDFAVYRGGTWIVQRISNGQVSYTAWGADGDTPVAGDYNGDGSADFAVWRSGTFYVLQSGGSPNYFTWGQAGDLPVASIFNN